MKEILTFVIISLLLMTGAYNSEYSWYMPVALGMTAILYAICCISLAIKYHPKGDTDE